jgi:ATP-dependent Clp protease ATP-binding subunit ClpC
MKQHYVGIEHLLVGLLREGESIAAGVLERRGVKLAKVLTETIKVLDQQINP